MTSATNTVDAAAQASIGAAARELHLPTVREEAAPLAERPAGTAVAPRLPRRGGHPTSHPQSPKGRRSPEPAVEAADRFQRRRRADHPRSCPRPPCRRPLHGRREPVVLLGDSGTGKCHLLIGPGLAACEQGRRVRYATTAQLVNELVEAADERVLSRVVARYGRLDLLLLDELGYVQIDPRGAELLFQIITEREERASIAIATNLPFSEWGTVFPDPRLVAAIVDRVTFNANILETHHVLPAPHQQDQPAQASRLTSGKTPRPLALTHGRRTRSDHEPPAGDAIPPTHDVDAQPLLGQTVDLWMPTDDIAHHVRMLSGGPSTHSSSRHSTSSLIARSSNANSPGPTFMTIAGAEDVDETHT